MAFFVGLVVLWSTFLDFPCANPTTHCHTSGSWLFNFSCSKCQQHGKSLKLLFSSVPSTVLQNLSLESLDFPSANPTTPEVFWRFFFEHLLQIFEGGSRISQRMMKWSSPESVLFKTVLCNVLIRLVMRWCVALGFLLVLSVFVAWFSYWNGAQMPGFMSGVT